MKIHSPLFLLAALGVLSAPSAAQGVDTSQWTCETCPFEKAGTTGVIEGGIGNVSDKSARFGDYRGLNRKGALAVGSASLRHRGAEGWNADVDVVDITPDAVTLTARGGQSGRYALRFGYGEIQHELTDSARTPFLGVGGAVLTLPGGFPAGSTAAMPLAGTLRPVDLAIKRSRVDAGVSWLGTKDWTFSLDTRHVVRDGTQRSSGSFFANAAQLVAPVDQTTDEVEATAAYTGRALQATLGYRASLFRNALESLTWSNPFANAFGAATGQMALPPDNQFHQVHGSIGYQFTPSTRASADVAVGRMTQDATYLASTLNAGLAVAGLPSQTLNGRASTVNASVRVTSALNERMRLNASYVHDERDNDTSTALYPGVSTDMFVGLPRSSQAFSFKQDRLKVEADYRGPRNLSIGIGAQHDARERNMQEVGTTRESTVFARVGGRPLDNVSVWFAAAHAERDHTRYTAAAWIDPPENPLMRKFNLAERLRDTASARVDVALGEKQEFNIGVDLDYSVDDYKASSIGLIDGRSVGLGADVSAAVTDTITVTLFGRVDRIRSRQFGSQAFGLPDWTARVRDGTDLVGVGVRYAVIENKLDVGADLTYSRSTSEVSVDTGGAGAPFPAATTALDSAKLFATYKLRDNLWLTGSYWWERYDAADWRLDGVLPATIPNYLAFGEQPPRYRVNVVKVALRYRF